MHIAYEGHGENQLGPKARGSAGRQPARRKRHAHQGGRHSGNDRPLARLHRRALVGSDLHICRCLQILPGRNRHLLVIAGDVGLGFVVPGGTVGEGHQEIHVASIAGAAFGEYLDTVLDQARRGNGGG